MNKLSLLSILLTVCLCASVSCSELDTKSDAKISFIVAPFSDDSQLTKTSLINGTEFIWSEGDTVGIYPNSGCQIYFSMSKGAGAKQATFDGGGWDFKPSAIYYSYYPFIGDIYLDRNHINVSYLGQCQPGVSDIKHIGPYDYMYTPATSADNGSLLFNYNHLNCIIRVTATLKAGSYKKMTVSCNDVDFTTSGYFDLESDSPSIIPLQTSHSLTLSLKNIILEESEQVVFYLMSAPVAVKGKKLVVSFVTSDGTIYAQEKTPSKDYAASSIGGLSCNALIEQKIPIEIDIDDWKNEN